MNELISQVELAALVLLTPSIMFYIFSKRIVINTGTYDKREKALELINNKLRAKLNNYEQTKESLNFYQGQLTKVNAQYYNLSIKYKAELKSKDELEQRMKQLIDNTEKVRVQNYVNR